MYISTESALIKIGLQLPLPCSGYKPGPTSHATDRHRDQGRIRLPASVLKRPSEIASEGPLRGYRAKRNAGRASCNAQVCQYANEVRLPYVKLLSVSAYGAFAPSLVGAWEIQTTPGPDPRLPVVQAAHGICVFRLRTQPLHAASFNTT